jgi:hypothetical protein
MEDESMMSLNHQRNKVKLEYTRRCRSFAVRMHLRLVWLVGKPTMRMKYVRILEQLSESRINREAQATVVVCCVRVLVSVLHTFLCNHSLTCVVTETRLLSIDETNRLICVHSNRAQQVHT